MNDGRKRGESIIKRSKGKQKIKKWEEVTKGNRDEEEGGEKKTNHRWSKWKQKGSREIKQEPSK